MLVVAPFEGIGGSVGRWGSWSVSLAPAASLLATAQCCLAPLALAACLAAWVAFGLDLAHGAATALAAAVVWGCWRGC